MLSSISWSEYAIFFAAVTTAYYALLAATCYRKEIAGRFLKRTYQPKYRTDISIPVENGVMGSVLFDGPDEKPTPGYLPTNATQPDAGAETTFPGEEDFEPDYDDDGEVDDGALYDAYDNEADHVAKMEMVEELVGRLTEAINKAPRSITADELVEQLSMIPSKADKELLSDYRESITDNLIEKVALRLRVTLTEKALRPLWT